MTERKRVTVKVCDNFPEAWDLCDVLRKGGADAKVVIKCAVQIHPDQVEMAKTIVLAEEQKRKDTPWPIPSPAQAEL